MMVSSLNASSNAASACSYSSNATAHFPPSTSFLNRQNANITNRRPSSPIQSSHCSPPPHHSNPFSHSSYPSSISTIMSSTAFCHSPSTGGGNGESVCAVCGDGHAKLHYGVLACYGCKGFFRRTLTGRYRYVCRFGNNCVVDKFQRNSCRCCRFQRCMDVGMDPKAVRPDRDLTGKQKVPRNRKRAMDEELINHMMRLKGDDWSRKIPLDSKMLLMQLLNIESKVAKGDESSLDNQTTNLMNWSPPPESASNLKLSTNSMDGFSSTAGDTLKNVLSLKDLFEQKPSKTRRTEQMSYKPSRMARAKELPKIAHRGAIAAVDWVESLNELIEPTLPLDTQDKISLVKAGYAPLTIFNFSARTAQNTMNPDILCLCSYSYVPRKLPADFNGSNHLSNNLIDRTLNELVVPLRRLALHEEEVVALKAIIILDPNAKCLSPEAQRGVAELRDRVQDMLFQVVKELHPTQNAASRFGNLLLLLPTITTLSGLMCENMQFCQVFGWTDPLLNELFEPSGDDASKGGGADQFAAFLDDSGTGGLIPISYSPPILADSQHCLNPADISLNSNEQLQGSSSSPGSLPRNLTSSRLSSVASTSSSSPPIYSSSPAPDSSIKPLNSTEKCEISTQTDEIGGNQLSIASSQDAPLAEMGCSAYAFYTFDEHSNVNPLIYGQQDDDVVTNFASQSPFPSSFFDHHQHNGPNITQNHRNDDLNPLNHSTNSMEFSTTAPHDDDDDESLLFSNGPTAHHHHTTADDLFGLIQ